jgi:DNA topoisomerase-1
MAVALPQSWAPETSPGADAADPEVSAWAAGLRYVSDADPGIRRKRSGETFKYLGSDGDPVTDEETLQRIKSLVIPPAWNDVWICAMPRGHLQATGRDARGRKQYRYHPRWRAVRDAVKYDRMLEFAELLPRIRERTDADLQLPGLPREKVLAAVVRLLEETRIRVGNEEYRKENGSFGLTTLRNRHVEVIGSRVTFEFRGKSGKQHRVRITSLRLARIIKRCQELPGQELFRFRDEDGKVKGIESEDVNDYLREITGEDFTAKDFRTWAGTVLAARFFRETEPSDEEETRQTKKVVVRTIARVAAELGNTPAVCRKCYIHPAVITAYLDGSLGPVEQDSEADPYGLSAEEMALLSLLSSG